MAAANAAIYFLPEGYTTAGKKLMGRQAAGEGFLRGFMRHAGVDIFYCYSPNKHAARTFAQLRDTHASTRIPVRWVGYGELSALSVPGTIYLPGPSLTEMAWRRRRVGARAFSLCGVTHTIASHTAMDALADLLTAPVAPWDALICTSREVLQSVQRLLDAEAEYLTAHLGAERIARPQLTLIPLGADCDAFAPDPAARREWRERLGIAEQDVAFLFLGRLSFHAKANPFPMYVALERAAQRSPRRLHLIQAGWFDNAHIETQFREGARMLCPAVNAIFLDGRDAAVRKHVWQAADVFTSLSDNIQETFGLTPIEAMAAALPSVVSDWDGYRDTVRDGVDGLLIPTLMASAPAGLELAQRHEDDTDSYDRYIGYASLAVSVDIPACADAYAALSNDPALRRRMGDAARQRARAEFDWSVIIGRYQALWQELGAIRLRAPTPSATAATINPRRTDPFWLFAEYPTRALAPSQRVALAPGASAERLAALSRITLVGFGGGVLASEQSCGEVMKRLAAAGELSVEELLAGVAEEDAQALARAIVWMHKLDLLRLS